VVVKRILKLIKKMMLSESYFNGDRLRAYLAILKDYEESSKKEMFDAVVVNDTAVVNVSVPVEEVIPSVLATVKVTETYEEIEYDFSECSFSSVLVSVCDNKRDVNHFVKDYSVVKKKSYDVPKKVKLLNGSWSKELNAIGSIHISLTPKSIPRRFLGPLCDVQFNNPIMFSNYVRNKDRLWLKYEYYPERWFDDLGYLGYAKFDYYQVDITKRAMLINDQGTLIIRFRGDVGFILATKMVGFPIFVCEGEMVDNKIMIYDMLNWNGRCVKSHIRHLRENYISQLISQFDKRGNDFAYVKPKTSLYSSGIDQCSILCVDRLGTYNMGHRIVPPPCSGFRLKMSWNDGVFEFQGYDVGNNLVNINKLPIFKDRHEQIVFLADFSFSHVGSCVVDCEYKYGILGVKGFAIGPIYKEGASLATSWSLRSFDLSKSSG
jgi:hypothetical protein